MKTAFHHATGVGLCLIALMLGLVVGCSEDPPAVPTAPQTTTVYLCNFAPEPVTEAYLRPVGTGDWGANLLEQPIPGGRRFVFLKTVTSGYYDFRIVGTTREIVTDAFPFFGKSVGLMYVLNAQTRASETPAHSLHPPETATR